MPSCCHGLERPRAEMHSDCVQPAPKEEVQESIAALKVVSPMAATLAAGGSTGKQPADQLVHLTPTTRLQRTGPNTRAIAEKAERAHSLERQMHIDFAVVEA